MKYIQNSLTFVKEPPSEEPPTDIPLFIDSEVPAICKMISTKSRFEGRIRKEYNEYLNSTCDESEMPARNRFLLRALNSLWPDKIPKNPSCVELRKAFFMRLQIPADTDVHSRMQNLYGDVKSMRRITPPPKDLSAVSILHRANEIMIKQYISNALWLELEVSDNSRRVIRQIQWKGLVWAPVARTVEKNNPMDSAEAIKIHISGPLSLLSSTKLYVNALCSMLPVLAWNEKFVLDIFTERHGTIRKFRYRPDAGMRYGKEPKLFDSKVESRFFKEFCKIEQNWDIVRESEPVKTSAGLFFPDFSFIHKQSGQKCFLEIVGFWRPEYLKQKIAKINAFIQSHQSENLNLIVCVDKKIGTFETERSKQSFVLSYDKHVCVKEIQRILATHERI